MKKRQQSTVNMFGVTISLVDATEAVLILEMPFFMRWYTAFKIIVGDIFVNMAIQGKNNKGLRQTKDELRAQLNACTVNLAANLLHYATAIGDMVLYNQMNIKKHFIDKRTDLQISPICNNIYAIALQYAAELAHYGVTAQGIADYGILLAKYKTAKPQPSAGIAEKKIATKNLAVLIAAANVQLNNMDGDVRALRLRRPEFNDRYFEVRKLVNLPTKVMAARVIVVSDLGFPMPLVHIRSPEMNLKRKTGKNGILNINTAREGIYELTADFSGYHTLKQLVTIIPGIRAEVRLTMHPINLPEDAAQDAYLQTQENQITDSGSSSNTGNYSDFRSFF